MQYISMANKLAMVQMVDRGALTPNEWREIMNLSPIEGGDVPIRRLDTAPTDQVAESQAPEMPQDVSVSDDMQVLFLLLQVLIKLRKHYA